MTEMEAKTRNTRHSMPSGPASAFPALRGLPEAATRSFR
jgi:hypothetical protein